MKNANRIYLAAGLAMCAGLAVAQTKEPQDLGPALLMNGSGQMQNSSATIRFAAYAIPGGVGSEKYGEGGIMDDTSCIHRYMNDPITHAAVGYDFSISGDATHGYLATFRALSKTGEDARIVVPKFPPPQRVKNGDTIFVELMASPDGSQRIVDYLQVVLDSPAPAAAVSGPAARDFTMDDVPLTFAGSGMTMSIDGQRWTGMGGLTVKPGSTFWLAVPGAGRYVLSLMPHPGMVKSGAVRDHVISFQADGHAYEVRFGSPIAGAGKAWNLYVAHDTTYAPRADMRNAMDCGVDRYENLLPGR